MQRCVLSSRQTSAGRRDPRACPCGGARRPVRTGVKLFPENRHSALGGGCPASGWRAWVVGGGECGEDLGFGRMFFNRQFILRNNEPQGSKWKVTAFSWRWLLPAGQQALGPATLSPPCHCWDAGPSTLLRGSREEPPVPFPRAAALSCPGKPAGSPIPFRTCVIGPMLLVKILALRWL